MTVEKGKPWGEAGPRPEGAVVVATDRQAREAVERARRAGDRVPVLVLAGGDLCRTLGGPAPEERLRAGLGTTFPVDLGAVLADGRLYWFLAHVVARTAGWADSFVAMNAQWRGGWNLGPRAHPNDGLLDVYEARLTPAERLKVWRRLPAGAHLPHPGIRHRRVPAVQVSFARPRWVELDGDRVVRARDLSIRLEPDAVTVVV